MNGLTAKQRQIVDYIKEYIEIHNYSPSLEEIRSHFCYSSISTIHDHLNALKKKQAIEFLKGSRRSITLKESPKKPFTIEIPIIGLFSSGLPLELFERQQEFYSIDHMLPNFDRVYALKIHGNGMLQELIFNQDLLLVEATSILESGDIGLISTKSGSTYLKKYLIDGEFIHLESLYPFISNYTETFKKEDLTIRGRLVRLIRDFNRIN
jgi:repressor LexA